MMPANLEENFPPWKPLSLTVCQSELRLSTSHKPGRSLGRETLSWRAAKITLACGHGCEAVFIVNWCRRAQPTMGGALPWRVGLNYLREVTEQATKLSRFVPASVPADGLENVRWNEYFPPQVPFMLASCLVRPQTAPGHHVSWRQAGSVIAPVLGGVATAQSCDEAVRWDLGFQGSSFPTTCWRSLRRHQGKMIVSPLLASIDCSFGHQPTFGKTFVRSSIIPRCCAPNSHEKYSSHLFW